MWTVFIWFDRIVRFPTDLHIQQLPLFKQSMWNFWCLCLKHLEKSLHFDLLVYRERCWCVRCFCFFIIGIVISIDSTWVGVSYEYLCQNHLLLTFNLREKFALLENAICCIWNINRFNKTKHTRHARIYERIGEESIRTNKYCWRLTIARQQQGIHSDGEKEIRN